jgi:hypothetical protein
MYLTLVSITIKRYYHGLTFLIANVTVVSLVIKTLVTSITSLAMLTLKAFSIAFTTSCITCTIHGIFVALLLYSTSYIVLLM